MPSLSHRAQLLASERQFSEALELADKAYKLGQSPKLLDRRAKIHWAKGDLHLALDDLAEAIEAAKPDDEALGSAHFHRGQILGDLGRHEEAILEMTKAIELPSSVLPGMDYVCRGQLYYRQGKHERAIADYDRGIEAFSGPGPQRPAHMRAQTYMNRSTIQWSAGNYEDSIAGLRKAIELFPDNADLYRKLARLLLSCPDANLRSYPDALELATKAIGLDPDNSQMGILALAQYRTGDFAGTVDTYMRMFEKARLKAGELLVLAMAHHQLGHQEEARQWYAKALKEYAKALQEIAKIAEPESIHDIPDKKLKEISEAWLADIRSEAEQLLGITQDDFQTDSDGQANDTAQESDQPTDVSSDGETAQPTEK